MTALKSIIDGWQAAIAVWTIVLYHVAVHVIFAAPHWRYALVIILALGVRL